ncbi:putative Membrane protein [Pseudomonas amygdali pv. aesculi]|nr:putative Membrane protein [Pseudomonas amygdali pv. aesculi]
MHSILDFYQTLGWGLSALVIGTFLLAGTVKGVIGLGLPTVAMGLLGLAMLPAQAAALLIIPSTFTNVWQLATGGNLRPLLKRLWPMLSMIFIGTLAGAFWLGMSGSHSMTRALGGALFLYALSGLLLPTFRVAAAKERWLGPLCCFHAGVGSGLVVERCAGRRGTGRIHIGADAIPVGHAAGAMAAPANQRDAVQARVLHRHGAVGAAPADKGLSLKG